MIAGRLPNTPQNLARWVRTELARLEQDFVAAYTARYGEGSAYAEAGQVKVASDPPGSV